MVGLKKQLVEGKMSPENHVVIYAVRSVVQHLIKQGVIDQNEFNQDMDNAEFELRKMLGVKEMEVVPTVREVFEVITSRVDE